MFIQSGEGVTILGVRNFNLEIGGTYMSNKKNKKKYLIWLVVSFVFTFFILYLAIWDIPIFIFLEGKNNLQISRDVITIIRATSLFVIDIFIKITLLLFMFRKS